MKINKCSTITSFKKNVERLAVASPQEWRGRQVTFGNSIITLANITQFLKTNNLYWIKSANPTLSEGFRELAKRIRLEFAFNPIASHALSDLLEDKSESMKLPSDLLTMIQARIPLSKKSILESYEEFKSFQKIMNCVSKDRSNQSLKAQVAWINYHKASLTRILKTDSVDKITEFTVKFGPYLECLDLNETFKLTDTLLRRILEASPNLKCIRIQGFTHDNSINNETIQYLLRLYPHLEELSLNFCNGITALPNPLPNTLKILKLANMNLKQDLILPTGLVELELENWPRFTRLTKLPTTLKALRVKNCRFDFSELSHAIPSDLEVLDLRSVDSLPKMPKNLRYLTLENLNFIPKLDALPNSLVSLRLIRCGRQIPDILPASLRILNLEGTINITELPKIWPRQMESLLISGLHNLKKIYSFPETLKKLSLCSCYSLSKIPKSFGRELTHLDLYRLEKLKRLPFILPNTLIELSLISIGIKTLPILPKNLNDIKLCSLENLAFIPMLPPNLEILFLSSLKIKTLPLFPSNLKKLTLSSLNFEQLPEDCLLDGLQSLTLQSLFDLKQLPQLSKKLTSFSVCSLNGLTEISKKWPEKLASIQIDNLAKLKTILFPFPHSLKNLLLRDLPLLNHIAKPLFFGKFYTIDQCKNLKITETEPKDDT